jgi:hypothetical protein
MKLVVNQPLIKQRKSLAQVMTFASLAVLGIGLFFAFQKDITKMYYSYIALVVGFVLSQVGMYFTTRFGRSPRFDEVITTSLEKLRQDYSFADIHDVGWTLPDLAANPPDGNRRNFLCGWKMEAKRRQRPDEDYGPGKRWQTGEGFCYRRT